MKSDNKQSKMPTPNFRSLDKAAVARAQAALAGGRQDPLVPPKDAKTTADRNGVEYTRWAEKLTITQAYRSVTKKGLMDVAIVAKVRQSTKENTGRRVFGHFYINLNDELPEGHDQMNDRSNGAIVSLLNATGFMPDGGALSGTLLDKMFPAKNQPGASSPLNGKAAIGNIVQVLGPSKNPKTGRPIVDEDGEPILEKRDQIESFLPNEGSSADDDDDDEVDQDDDDDADDNEDSDDYEADDDDSDDADDDAGDDTDDDDDDDDDDNDDDDEAEEEEEAPRRRPTPKSSKPVKKVVKKSSKKTRPSSSRRK